MSLNTTLKSIFAAGLIVFGFLAWQACAPISEDGCKSDSWYALGLRDGQNGEDPSRIYDYSEECIKYGVRPEQKAWQDGRTEGLKTYCTPKSAYRIGKNGKPLQGYCENEENLLPAYHMGREHNGITQQISKLYDDRSEIRSMLVGELSVAENSEEADLRRKYRRLLSVIEDQIESLETQRDDIEQEFWKEYGNNDKA